ncbi:MAG: GNAT family N-acetyltransferase [Chthoniobacter sp.]|nr:GNAT family N-acetyltransferase [Chthoniobacter sp.]
MPETAADAATTGAHLREAGADDRDFLCRVYASTRAEELALTDWSEEQKAEFCRMQFTAQDAHYREHYPTAQFSVIERDGVPAGRLFVDRWTKEIRIMDIALLPEHRNVGTGTQFLRALMEEARAAGKTLSIHVEKFNPALRLYDRLGFRPREDKGVYLLMEWKG